MKDQLVAEGVELGWDTYIVPGRARHALGHLRAGLGHPRRADVRRAQEGRLAELPEILQGPHLRLRHHLRADPRRLVRRRRPGRSRWASRSSPTTTPPRRSAPTGVTTYEALVRQTDPEQLVPTCIQVRGVKVKVEEIDIPVSYSPAFEGERIRREDMQVAVRRQVLQRRRAAGVGRDGRGHRRRDHRARQGHRRRQGRRRHGPGRPRPRGRAEDEEGLRGHPRAPDPPLLQRGDGLHAHRPARPDLVPRQQGGLRGGLPPQAHRHDPPRQAARRVRRHRGQGGRRPSRPTATRSPR